MSIEIKTLCNVRLMAALLIGFSSGLPLALTNSTLQAWFTQANINVITIGALSLIGIPYILKFLWAPLMDHFSLPWLGKRRGWIVLMQLCLIGGLLFLAQMDPASQAVAMGVVALCIAFFSASQDVAIDAYRTDLLKPEERGLGAAYFVFAYRIAMLVAGGLALICADYIGWKLTYEIMAGLVLLMALPTIFAPKVSEAVAPPHIWQTIVAGLKDLLTREKIVFLLLFIVFYKFGDALALSLMTNFLLHDLGFTLKEVGLAYKIVGFIATILGAFMGGLLLIRWNLYRGLLVFGLAQAFSNLMFVVLAIADKQFWLMATSIFIENFCSGLSTAAFTAFLMSLCNLRFTASQYALLSAVAASGRVFLGPVAGVMVAAFGWTQFFIWAFILSFPGLFFLMLLKQRVLAYATVN